MTGIVTADGPIAVARWSYQLQGRGGAALDPAAIAAIDTDLMVIDYSRNGSGAGAFTPGEVDLMQGTGADRKGVVAYISIGETEDFRFYWNTAWTKDGSAGGKLTGAAPDWLGPINPDWKESRKVRYWDPEWKAIAFQWIEKIAGQGFDGAYLDIVDAYYFWAHEAKGKDREPGDPKTGSDAAARMIDFIVELADHARAINPDFVLIQQNAPFLIADLVHDTGGKAKPDPVRVAALHDALAGIAIEDAYLRGGKDENNRFKPDKQTIKEVMAAYGDAGEIVLGVDYVSKPKLVTRYLRQADKDGFISFAAPDRDLDRQALHGTPAGDTLTGTTASDRLYGRGGDDILAGGAKKDILIGGPGADTFLFDTALGKGAGKAGVDRIADFKPGLDHIALDDTIFSAIGATLDAGEFRKGGKAKDGNDLVLFAKNTGLVRYDPDGNGDLAPIKFAKLEPGKALSHHDFLMA